MKFTVLLNPAGTHTITKGLGSDIQKVSLEVSPGDSLWEIAKRAETEAGVEVPHGRLLFCGPPSVEGVRELVGAPSAVVKEDGALTWLGYPQDYEEVTIADLGRTYENGLFDGDVAAVVLDKPTVGNGGVVHAWGDLLDWLVKVGAIYGGIAAIRDVVSGIKNRLQIGREDDISSEAAWLAEFVERHREKWEGRGAKTPVEFLAVLLGQRQWDSGRLRRLLQIDIEESAKFLEICGYEYNVQTKLHELTPASTKRHLRARLLEEFLGYDPATWRDDLGQEGP